MRLSARDGPLWMLFLCLCAARTCSLSHCARILRAAHRQKKAFPQGPGAGSSSGSAKGVCRVHGLLKSVGSRVPGVPLWICRQLQLTLLNHRCSHLLVPPSYSRKAFLMEMPVIPLRSTHGQKERWHKQLKKYKSTHKYSL